MCSYLFFNKGYYTCVEVAFTLRRQVGFYMMGVYAPTLLIVVLSWLSFWINPDASAARVPLGNQYWLSLCVELENILLAVTLKVITIILSQRSMLLMLTIYLLLCQSHSLLWHFSFGTRVHSKSVSPPKSVISVFKNLGE